MRVIPRGVTWLPLLLFALAVAAESEEDDVKVENKLRIERNNDYVRSKSKFMVSCVFDGDEVADLSDIQWKTDNGKIIDSESSSSVFTIALLEHSTTHKKRNLHFSAIDIRDTGDYICEAKDLDGKVHRRKVHIKVLPPVEWADPSTTIGGLVGEPITIDCTARGDPEPSMQITDEKGEPLDENLFTIAGNEVTVQSLTKEYNGKVVSCVALQVLSEYDTTSTELKDVKIDVWHAPEFAAEKIVRYAIIGRQAVIPCNITASNPVASQYTFYRDDRLLRNPARFQILNEVRYRTSAALVIKSVTPEDMGDYRCDVSNRKAKGSIHISLKEARAPDEVKATIEKVKKHSIVWRLECNADVGELPIEKISIGYVRKRLLHDENDYEDENDDEYVWKHHGTHVERNTTNDHLYEITGLRMDTVYVFRFHAISQAGQGDQVQIVVSTAGEDDSKEQEAVGSASRSFATTALIVSYLLYV